MKILAPSILSADFSKLGEQIKLVEKAGAKYLHFDVMDGHFVPNISFGPVVLESVRKITNMVLDVHLMISEPEKYIDDFAKAGADIINFHIEAVDEPIKIINKIKATGKKVGITLKPKTDIESVFKYLPNIDMVLIMSVEPGFGGQKFMQDSLVKVDELHNYIIENKLNVDIEIDGGINISNAKMVADAGVNIIVAGSAVFGAENIEKTVAEFINAIN